QVVADVAEIVKHHVDVDAASRSPGRRDLVDRRLLDVVDPDRQLRHFCARVRRLRGTAADERQCYSQDDGEQDGETPSYLHRSSSSSSPATREGGADCHETCPNSMKQA